MKTDKNAGKKRKDGRKDEWEYSDDCAVCQAMKFAEKHGREPSFSELIDAFQRVNARQN